MREILLDYQKKLKVGRENKNELEKEKMREGEIASKKESKKERKVSG
jgi:hypothetical protein